MWVALVWTHGVVDLLFLDFWECTEVDYLAFGLFIFLEIGATKNLKFVIQNSFILLFLLRVCWFLDLGNKVWTNGFYTWRKGTSILWSSDAGSESSWKEDYGMGLEWLEMALAYVHCCSPTHGFGRETCGSRRERLVGVGERERQGGFDGGCRKRCQWWSP